MARILLTTADLCERLTAELRNIEECEACSVVGITRLKHQTSDGCNWSESVMLRTHGQSLARVQPHLTEIVRQARLAFNLTDQS